MEDRCVICGNIIPEGTEICPQCYKKWLADEENDPEKTRRRIRDMNKEQKEKRGDERIVIH
ncbi:MAG: hypothetical protein IJ740_08725 [Ruminococcus sp.]|nr:hypothetical protein [Ruminococcus sp.]